MYMRRFPLKRTADDQNEVIYSENFEIAPLHAVIEFFYLVDANNTLYRPNREEKIAQLGDIGI